MDANHLTTVRAVSQDAPARDVTWPVPLNPLFAPNETTTWFYTWNASGRVTSISVRDANNNGNAPGIPTGCIPSITGR